MILKRSSFFGCLLIQSFEIETLYKEICSVFERAYSPEQPNQICILSINCIVHLSFSFKRKLLISEEFISNLINMPEFPKNTQGLHSYSRIGALEVLLSNNRYVLMMTITGRDGLSIANSFNTETLIKLLSIKSDFIQFIALSILFSRLQFMIRPEMRLLPRIYPNTAIHVVYDHEYQARAYLSPCCLYLYTQNSAEEITCHRLDYTCMHIERTGSQLTLIPHTKLYSPSIAVMHRSLKRKKITMNFTSGEEICEAWYQHMRNNNVMDNTLLQNHVKQAEECYLVYQNKGIFGVHQSSRTITHPLFYMITEESLKSLAKIVLIGGECDG